MNELLEKLSKVVSAGGLISGDALTERDFPGANLPIALVRPKSTDEVAQILKICHQAGQPIVPHGGLTGLVDATQSNQQELALNLERMNTIEEIDVQSRNNDCAGRGAITNSSGKAEEAGMLFPLDLGARGTATIGGNVSTNAGGNRVIRYGMMRDQVLGMEVVLADGTIISSMNKILKNNTGYDLKQLFIGSEGTLGVVTRLVLRMRPLPVSQEMALLAIDDFTKVTAFLSYIDSALGGTLSAYEVLWQDYYQLVTKPPAEGRAPLPHNYKYYVLLEALGGSITADQERFVAALSEALEQELIADAVIAQNQGERDDMWAIRDDVGQVAQNAPIFAFDISVSLNHMESYVEELKASLTERWPDHSCMIFGHLGDGNLHIIVGNGDSSIEAKKAIDETVYAGLPTRGGSVSAEHGIGLQKKEYLSWSRNSDEINLMKMLKQSLDPKDILNPGKIFA